MRTGLKVAGFAAALTASFGIAFGMGSFVDPIPVNAEPAAHAGHSGTQSGGDHTADTRSHNNLAGGLQVSDGDYTLDVETLRLQAGREAAVRFTIVDDEGRALTTYQKDHSKELHLIITDHDLTTYRHLHPSLAADGTWSAPVHLPQAGDYRLFADFTPAAKDAENVTLGADLAVSGTYRPALLPPASRSATVDGYTVRLDGSLRPGSEAQLTMTVSRNGRRVTNLQPYLAAYGHLVALRAGDLAYLHVHPNGAPGDGVTQPGPRISFTTAAPSPGTYRLFLDFKHDGAVHTAAFTLRAE